MPIIGQLKAGFACAVWPTAGLAAVYVVAISTLRARFQRDLARASKRLADAGSTVVKTPCGPIEYAIAGEGIPVLEVHGIFGGFDQGLVVARAILGDDFQIIAPSRFGYLRTPLPSDATPEKQADAYVCLLDHLGVDRIAVISHSAGSPSAIQLALRHPKRVRALVLIVPAAPGPGPAAPPEQIVRALFRTEAVFWFFATFFPRLLVGVPIRLELAPQDVEEMARVSDTLLPARPRREGFLFDVYVSTPAINSGYPFGSISAPTLVITASDDSLASPDNARRLAAAIPNARLLEVRRGGHLLLGQAGQVGDQVKQFILAHSEGSGS